MLKLGAKLQGSQESWWSHHCSLVCLACPPLPSLPHSNKWLSQGVSGSSCEWGSGGRWWLGAGGRSQGVGGWSWLTLPGRGPEKWQNEPRTRGADPFPGWPGSGAVWGPHECLGCSQSLGGSGRGLGQGLGIPVLGRGAAPAPGLAPAASGAGETLLTCPELLSAGWAPEHMLCGAAGAARRGGAALTPSLASLARRDTRRG